MKRIKGARLASLAAMSMLALGGLAACGSSDDNSATDPGTTGGTSAPADGGSSAGGSGADAGMVGVILPDTTTSPRWEANDRPSLQKAFDDAGVQSDIQNADGDVSKFGTICDGMINEGVTVIMIVNLDSDSGAACLKKAKAAGVQSIDYDRLTLGGGASYYVSFDNVEVGKLMGAGLDTCLSDAGTNPADIVYIDGDPKDNNAALFKQGYEDALKPKIDDGTYNLVGDQSGFWDATKAGTAFEQLYTAANGKIDGVVSANDTMAGGIIARLKANGLAGKVPVTGQDASTEGLQNILLGNQCGSVYKNTDLEAQTASKLAIALATGDTAGASALATGSVPDTKLNVDVPSALATPVWITTDNVEQPFTDGFAKASDVCTGAVAAMCTKYGVK